MEYFCAVEIVNRFEKQRTISFEQLRDKIFGQHWQDETWHEVLRLICGMIDTKFAGELIEFLMTREVDGAQPELFSHTEIKNLLLAIQCLIEVENPKLIATTANQLLELIKRKIEDKAIDKIVYEAVIQMAEMLATAWNEDSAVLCWLQTCLNISSDTSSWWVSYFAMVAIVRGWKNSINILPFLKTVAQQEGDSLARKAAVEELVEYWKDDPDTLLILKKLLTQRDENSNARQAAVGGLVKYWKDDPDTLLILKKLAQQDDAWIVQIAALGELSQGWKDDPDTLPTLKKLAQKGNSSSLRWNALLTIEEFWLDEYDLEIIEFLCQVAINDPFERKKYWEVNPRQAALRSLLNHYPNDSKTLELLRDRAINDPDEQLREWAREQWQRMENESV